MEKLIKLDDNYSIKPDTYCWILDYEKVTGMNESTGKPIISKRQTFHGGIKQALKSYCDEIIKDGLEYEGLDYILKKIDELDKKIDSLEI